jgi:hypothetical protein
MGSICRQFRPYVLELPLLYAYLDQGEQVTLGASAPRKPAGWTALSRSFRGG